MMSARTAGLAIALALGCTGSNPAFDPDIGSVDATADDDGGSTTTDRPNGSDVESEGSTRATSVESSTTLVELDTTDTDPTGTACEVAEELPLPLILSLREFGCPTFGFVQGGISEIAATSFSVADCNGCGACDGPGPIWSFGVPQSLLPADLAEGDCVEVHFDCEAAIFPELRNLALVRDGSGPALVIAAPALPQTLGGWAPTAGHGAPCPTLECPDNAEMPLNFVEESFKEGDGGRGHIFVGDNEFSLDIAVGNAHYDPMSCKEIVRWLGKE